MSEARNQRRLAKKAARIATKQKPPAGRELFRVDPGGGCPAFILDITAMRQWATQKLKAKAVKLDEALAHKLVSNGSVDKSHLKSCFDDPHDLEPMIICRNICTDGGDMIVDGNHRYVAAVAAALPEDFEKGAAPGFVLMPDEWRPFVVDPEIAALNGVAI